MTAQWKANCTENCTELDLAVNESIGYDYTGSVVGVTLKKAGYYKLEVWGAQGGGYNDTYRGGFGGYSNGVITASVNDMVYATAGQAGTCKQGPTVYIDRSYNGGGYGTTVTGFDSYSCSGGGATHIATRTGVLSSLSSYQSSVLIVAGGGGGAIYGVNYANYRSRGGSGGGMEGGYGHYGSYGHFYGYGGTQSYGGSTESGCKNQTADSKDNNNAYTQGIFGQGGDGCHWMNGGGGGGWYGGGGSHVEGAGGGSGYIGNSLLLSAKGITKQMYMYSEGCSSSTATATKTTCTSSTGHAVANRANTDNGYARITYLGT